MFPRKRVEKKARTIRGRVLSDLARYAPTLDTAVGFGGAEVDPAKVAFAGSPEHCAERIRALQAAGVWHFVLEFQFHGLETVEFGMRQMEKFVREVAPLL